MFGSRHRSTDWPRCLQPRPVPPVQSWSTRQHKYGNHVRAPAPWLHRPHSRPCADRDNMLLVNAPAQVMMCVHWPHGNTGPTRAPLQLETLAARHGSNNSIQHLIKNPANQWWPALEYLLGMTQAVSQPGWCTYLNPAVQWWPALEYLLGLTTGSTQSTSSAPQYSQHSQAWAYCSLRFGRPPLSH